MTASPAAAVAVAVIMCSCLPVTSPLPQLPGKPVLQFAGMTPVPDPFNGYREAVHLTWAAPPDSSAPVCTYTLLRRIPPDSIFDVFAASRLIPADTADFYDDLASHAFPTNGFDSIYYRICAIDSFARTGDTSAVTTVILAPQPTVTAYDTANACLQWDSWIRGGVFSWCTLWRESGEGATFTSPPEQKFPFTDEPARFLACFPDSLSPPAAGRWYFALYVKANESYSLNVGFINVP